MIYWYSWYIHTCIWIMYGRIGASCWKSIVCSIVLWIRNCFLLIRHIIEECQIQISEQISTSKRIKIKWQFSYLGTNPGYFNEPQSTDPNFWAEFFELLRNPGFNPTACPAITSSHKYVPVLVYLAILPYYCKTGRRKYPLSQHIQ